MMLLQLETEAFIAKQGLLTFQTPPPPNLGCLQEIYASS